jgi:hypothetical protein
MNELESLGEEAVVTYGKEMKDISEKNLFPGQD